MIREVKGELHHLECNWYSHYKQLKVRGHGETPNFLMSREPVPIRFLARPHGSKHHDGGMMPGTMMRPLCDHDAPMMPP
jgi:hypothetical protein